jgi:hypothetical protein
MRSITPVGVVKAMAGLEPKTSEWKQQVSAIHSELDETMRLDPVGVGVGSCTWTAMLSRLQLEIIKTQGKHLP